MEKKKLSARIIFRAIRKLPKSERRDLWNLLVDYLFWRRGEGFQIVPVGIMVWNENDLVKSAQIARAAIKAVPRKGKKWRERNETIWQYQDQGLTAAQITPKILAVKEWAKTEKGKDFDRKACQKVMNRNPKKPKLNGRI